MIAEKAVNSQMLIIDRDRKLLRMRLHFGGLGEWFKPAVLKTADRMLNAVRPFESDILLALIDLRCCFDVGRSVKR